MMSHLTVICADIVAYGLIWIAPSKTGEGFADIVLIPVIRSEQVSYTLIFPCRIVLIMQSGSDGPSRVQPVFSRRDCSRLGMSRHEIAENIRSRNAGRSIGWNGQIGTCKIGILHSGPVDLTV